MFGRKLNTKVLVFFLIAVFLYLGPSQVNAAGEQVIYSSANGDQILMRDSVGEYFVNGMKISNNKSITWNRKLENTWVGGSFTREQNIQFIDGISEIKSVQFASFKSNYANEVPHAFVLKVGHVLMSCREAQFSGGEWNTSFKDVFGNYTPRYTDYDGNTLFPSDGDSYLIINVDTGKVVDFVSKLNPYYYGKAENYEIIDATEGSNSLEIPSVQPQIELSEIQDNQATMSWNSVPYGLEYEVEINSDTTSTNSNSMELKNLSSNTEYQVRIRAKNELGSGPWSEYLTFRTKLHTPEVTYSTTSSTIQLNWLPIEGAEGYEVEADGIVVPVASGTSYTHNGLSSATMHTYKVRAVGDVNVSEWSALISAHTLPDKIRSLTADSTITTIVLSWAVVPGTNEYEVELDDTVVKTVNTTTATLSGLQPNQDYRIRVRANNIGGYGEWSDTIQVKTKLTKPEILTVSPNKTNLPGNGVTVVISGQDFVPGSTVLFNSTSIPTTYVNNTKLQISTPLWNKAESVTVIVMNPDGQWYEIQGGFTYVAPPSLPAPTISSLSPNSGLVTGNNIIAINGANFVSGTKVQIGEISAATTFYSSKELRVRMPAASSAGMVNVTVINPDGQIAVLTNGYTYELPAPDPAPVITSISPSSGALTGENIITINGANFVSGIKVQIGGVQAATTFYTSKELKVRVPAGNSVGMVDVTIINPDGQIAQLSEGYMYN